MTYARVRSVCTTEYAESRSERWANGSSRDSASYRDGAPRIEETRNQCRSLPWPWRFLSTWEFFPKTPRKGEATDVFVFFISAPSVSSFRASRNPKVISFFSLRFELSLGMKNSISLKASQRQNISHFVGQGSGCLAGVIPGEIGKKPATLHSPWHEFCYFSLFQFLAAAELFTKNSSPSKAKWI